MSANGTDNTPAPNTAPMPIPTKANVPPILNACLIAFINPPLSSPPKKLAKNPENDTEPSSSIVVLIESLMLDQVVVTPYNNNPAIGKRAAPVLAAPAATVKVEPIANLANIGLTAANASLAAIVA